MVDQQPAQDVITGDSHSSIDSKGQEEAGDWFHFGVLFETKESVTVPTCTPTVPKTESEGCPDHRW